ncbi:MAG: hypothetical protein CMH26_02185 [Micavibrio sp.]|nr:hypothetical protein [Micavibrio sp.]
MTKDRISKEQFCIFMSAQENAQTITSFDSHKGTIELKDGQFVEAIQIDNSREGPDKLSVSVRDANNELKIHFGVTQLNAKDGISFTLDNEYVYAVQSPKANTVPLTHNKKDLEPDVSQRVKENLGLVFKLADKYINPRLSTKEDYIQAGIAGLTEAEMKADPSMHPKQMSTYRAQYIVEAFRQLKRKSQEIHIPKLALEELNVFIGARKTLKNQNHGIEPKLSDVAAELNISLDQALTLEKRAMAIYGFEHLDEVRSGKGGDYSSDIFNTAAPNPETIVTNDDFIAFLHRVIEDLDERKQFIVRNYYGINCKEMTLSELGEELGISSERSRQLLKDAKEKLLIALQKYNISIEDTEPADQTPSKGFNEHDLSIKSFS